jgi:GT2 family glycosyltransferase
VSDKRDLHVTIPTYGQFDYVKKTLASLDRCKLFNIGMRVFIVDDGSPDWFAYASETTTYNLSCQRLHFMDNAGLTRSWNIGLRQARDLGYEYAVIGNSDILFTPGWYYGLKDALEQYALVGPVTNAPGHCPWQSIERLGIHGIDDHIDVIDEIAITLHARKLPAQQTVRVNGFFLMAKTKTWWDNAYDADNVFDPKYKLTGNEDELQRRWDAKGLKFAYVPTSFIFHYRSVSRPQALASKESKGAFRPK